MAGHPDSSSNCVCSSFKKRSLLEDRLCLNMSDSVLNQIVVEEKMKYVPVNMLQLRATNLVLIVWIAFISNVERLFPDFNLASFVYILVGLTAAIIVFLPKMRDVAYIEIAALTVPGFLILKWLLGYGVVGDNFTLTVTEGLVLCLTTFLSWCVARQIDDFLKMAGQMVAVESTMQNLSLKACEARMYGEIQRARRFHRPLTVASVQFDQRFDSVRWEELSQHARDEVAKQYLQARLAVVMSEFMEPGDIVANKGGQFVIVFPERERSEASEVLSKISDAVTCEVGVNLRCGLAEFPDEECTLTGLISRAESACESGDSLLKSEMLPLR
jgi:GGDEF domain-containing protein